MDVALPFQLLQHGIPIEAQAGKRVKRDVRDSPIHGDTEENATNSPEVSDSEASSQSESTVDAADCDSDLEEFRDSYTSLQALTAEMREPEASFQQRGPQMPHSQEWDFREGRRVDQISILASNLATSPAIAPHLIVKQMETLLQNYCFEIIAACKTSEQDHQYVY